jgi:hypothetical protein
MPSADIIESHMAALAAAVTQLAADGSTLDGAGQVPVAVTASDTRRFLILNYAGEGAHARMRRDLDRGVPPMLVATLLPADGAAMVFDSAIETVVIARIRK